jgi:O-antigen ligase
MNSIIIKQNNLLIYYQCGLAVLAILIFFTNLDVYLEQAAIIPLAPLHWIIMFMVASLPLARSLASRRKFFPKLLLRWCAGYFLISLFYLLLFLALQLSPHDAFQTLKDRILAISFILMMLLIYSKYYLVHICAGYAFIAAGLLGTFNNIYEFFNPLIFSALNDTGRPAGFYVNSNNCGCALIESLIIGVTILPPICRIPYACLISFGVFLTFSRGALLACLIVMLIFIIMGVITRRQLLWWSIGLVILMTALIGMAGNSFNLAELEDMGLLNSNILQRLSQTEGSAPINDDSTLARLEVVRLAWQMFIDHPLIGNGIGSTHDLNVGGLSDHNISTHNMYLYFLTDHGILGGLIYPLLIFATICPFKAENKCMNFSMAVFLFIWGFFSHTLVSLRLHLVVFSLIATMNQTAQRSNT